MNIPHLGQRIFGVNLDHGLKLKRHIASYKNLDIKTNDW